MIGQSPDPRSHDDDLIELLDDELPGPHAADAWPILVVDDDAQVHAATRFALTGAHLLGRPIHLLHAHSAAETKTVMRQTPELAVILLDVVMEKEDSGLTLVRWIREELGLKEVRIILRTGQPGYAPELTVIEQYDINDYRTKQELTHNRLITTLTAALRSYEQIRALAYSRQGLEKIVRATAELTERHALESFAEGVLTQIASLLCLAPDGVLCVQRGSAFAGENGHELYIVGAAGQLASSINTPLAQLPNPRVIALIHEALQQHSHQFGATETVLYLHENEREGAVYIATGRPLDALDRQLLTVFAANIAVGFENVTLIQRLEIAAYFDALTKLPNRSQFITVLDRHAQNPVPERIVALIDIDHFADINDALGQDVGNQLLQAVAARLSTGLPETLVARIGADVFGLLGPDAEVKPENLLSLFELPLTAGEHQLPLTVTIGLCRALEARSTGLWLLKYANIALNRAKKSLRNRYEYYQSEMEEQTRWRLDVISRLRKDFGKGGLEVWYQPQVALADGAVIGLEALLRWPGSSPDMLSPAVFVPLAEYSGLIVDIGEWVLGQACAAQARLANSHGSLRMAVNVSVPQFRRHGFVELVLACLERHGLKPCELELEITESLVMDDPKVVTESLERLQGAGIAIAIDDFGTGFSSLSYLQQLPIDRLKIDRSFTIDVDQSKGRAIAETIITLSRRLSLKTIAEGVETEEQARLMLELGCDEAQGFLYAKPMPLPILEQWLAERRSATRAP